MTDEMQGVILQGETLKINSVSLNILWSWMIYLLDFRSYWDFDV